MAEWKKRAQIHADVIHFSYASNLELKSFEEIHLWDLDKTYLDTKFESLKGLMETAVERGFQKKNIPGTGTLVKSLSEQYRDIHEAKSYPIFFITASPPQIEGRILEKLRFDGIQPLGLFCKDNLKNLRPRRLWRLTKQLGYKIQALLELRRLLSADVRQVLWGDDSESDVVAYSIYSDICARRLSSDELSKVLRSLHVVGDQVNTIRALQESIPEMDPVEKIYINLAADTDSDYYLKFGRRVLPTSSTFQSALDLFQDGRLTAAHVVRVARDLLTQFSFSGEELERGFEDLLRRQVLARSTMEAILPELQREGVLHSAYEPSMPARDILRREGDRVFQLEGQFEPWVPDHIDYLHDYR